MAINQLDRNQPCVDKNGIPLQNLQIIIEQLRELEPLDGAGDPNGQYAARFKRFYIDSSTAELWVKKFDSVAGDKTQGWVKI